MTSDALVCERPRWSGSRLELGQLSARGPRLILVGRWAPLFRLLGGQTRLESGELRVAGMDASAAAKTGRVGLMLEEMPLPASWSVADVLTESAALLGHSRKAAAQLAAADAAELGLAELSSSKLSRLRPHERRAVAIASARLGDPLVIACERPFAGLDASGHALVARVLERACKGRVSLISLDQVPGGPEQNELSRSADELLFLGDGAASGLVARGSYRELTAGATSYRVVALRNAERLLERLAADGYGARSVSPGAPATLMVTDPDGRGTSALLRGSLDTDAPLIEIVPLIEGNSTTP